MSFIFKKKEEKGLEIMRERNRIYLEKMNGTAEQKDEEITSAGQNYAFKTGASKYDENGELLSPEEEKVEFEKGDLPAIIISAFLVFWPVFLLLIVLFVIVCVWIVRT